MFKFEYTKKAQKDLRKLESTIAKIITRKLDFFIRQENPLKFAKKLQNPKIGTYRFRIGDYRAIFDVDEKGMITILMILRIRHRKDIYGL